MPAPIFLLGAIDTSEPIPREIDETTVRIDHARRRNQVAEAVSIDRRVVDRMPPLLSTIPRSNT